MTLEAAATGTVNRTRISFRAAYTVRSTNQKWCLIYRRCVYNHISLISNSVFRTKGFACYKVT